MAVLVAGQSPPDAAATTGPATVDVTVIDSAGQPLDAYTRYWSAADLAAFQTQDVDRLHYFTYLADDRTETDDPGPQSGTSLNAVIRDELHLSPAAVDSISFTCPRVPTGGLSSQYGDFTDPTDPAFPFVSDPFQPTIPLPPVFAPVAGGQDFDFVVPIRRPPGHPPGVTDGKYCFVTPNTAMSMVIQLDDDPLDPHLTADPGGTVDVGQPVTFTGHLTDPDPGDTHAWSWNFGDSPQDVSTHADPVTTHTFGAACSPCRVTATVTGAHGPSGVATLDITVKGSSSSPPPPTTPPPGASHGNGSPSAPVVGPRDGTGPVVGGVPSAGDGGRAGRSADATASATASASGTPGAARPAGLVGFLLDGAVTATPAVPQAGKPRLDDTAPAARDGRPASHLLGWLAATLCVAALLLLGVGSERRRPSRRPRRS